MKLKVLLHLASEIQEEIGGLQQLKNLLERRGLFNEKKAKQVLADEIALRGIAGILQDYYSGVERVFKRVAVEIDERLPRGESWHRDLLAQMKREIPGLRPPLIAEETFTLLNELRSFRHRVGNIYTFNLLPEKVLGYLLKLPQINKNFEQDVFSFLARMKEMVEEEIESEIKAETEPEDITEEAEI